MAVEFGLTPNGRQQGLTVGRQYGFNLFRQ